ncbi:MAG: hypothetical protein RLZZ234_232 [Candidatus Parcubacteria bacterium]|jgi:UPF0755 protein
MLVGAPLTATLCLVFLIGYMVIQTREVAFDASQSATSERATTVEPFPIGVDPLRKTITELPNADSYLGDNRNAESLAERSVFSHIMASLINFSWYQNLASPSGRILIIQPGERKEEAARNFGKILGWTQSDRAQFMRIIASSTPLVHEGTYYPATYVTKRNARPEEVAPLVIERFETEVLSRYTEEVAAQVPLHDALTVASLLEREAAGFEDMRLISGVIWNRLFVGMKLQLDATLQYAKGNERERSFWTIPVPDDKNIKSPYNTYQNEGLPPSPIANPSLDAIVAALNPKKTDCMFYFHDDHGAFHCAPTYEGHVALLKQYYGQGK